MIDDFRADWIDVLLTKRALLLGATPKLELFNRDDTGAALAHTLTAADGWSVRDHAFGDGHQWDLDVWTLTWEQMSQLATAKIHAFGQVLTFRIDLNSRRFVAGNVCRLGMQMIGDGR